MHAFMYVCLVSCLSVCPVCVRACVCAFMSVCLCASVLVCLSGVCVRVCVRVRLSVCASVRACLNAYLSVRTSLYKCNNSEVRSKN